MKLSSILSAACLAISCVADKAEGEAEDELLSLFYGNTGLNKWWSKDGWDDIVESQIATLKESDYDFLCISDLTSPTFAKRYAESLKSVYPYSLIPGRDTVNSVDCKCTTPQFDKVKECLSAVTMDDEYADCFWKAADGMNGTTHIYCSKCWTSYYDQDVGIQSIDVCDGGNDLVQPEEQTPTYNDIPTCLYGDGLLKVMMVSKYPLTQTNYKTFSRPSGQANGVVTAMTNKDGVDYKVFCSGFPSFKHNIAMEIGANELVEFIKTETEDIDQDTVVLSAGDFNTGRKGNCVQCIDYPKTDYNLTTYNIITGQDGVFSLYENNFNQNGKTNPLCTLCRDNPRTPGHYSNYTGINIFGFNQTASKYDVTMAYIAKREWVEIDPLLNTSLSDKYAVGVMQSPDYTLIVDHDSHDSHDEDPDNGDYANMKQISFIALFVSSFFAFF